MTSRSRPGGLRQPSASPAGAAPPGNRRAWRRADGNASAGHGSLVDRRRADEPTGKRPRKGSPRRRSRARHEADQHALADQARLQAEARRVEADQQRHVAETNRTEALAQSRAAKTNFEQARKAVDDFFIKVSESKLKAVPGLRSLRAELLGSALGFYTELLKERAGDHSLRRDLLQSRFRAGRVLHELGRDSEAGAVLRTAWEGYERELHDHPDDIDLKAGLAAVTSLTAAFEPDAERKGAGLTRAIALREAVLRARPMTPRTSSSSPTSTTPWPTTGATGPGATLYPLMSEA